VARPRGLHAEVIFRLVSPVPTRDADDVLSLCLLVAYDTSRPWRGPVQGADDSELLGAVDQMHRERAANRATTVAVKSFRYAAEPT
jgi:hypothetical protein